MDSDSDDETSALKRSQALRQHAAHAIDFRGESLTFKATTNGILARLQHCLDLLNQSEDWWRKRLERQVEQRKKAEEAYRQLLQQQQQQEQQIHTAKHQQEQQLLQQQSTKIVVVGGPDYQEGPHSAIGEDEFYDAVEAGLDKIDEEQKYLERLKNKQVVRFASKAAAHPLWNEVCDHSFSFII